MGGFGFWNPGAVAAAVLPSVSGKVGIVVSRRIRPYQEATEGLLRVLEAHEHVQVLVLHLKSSEERLQSQLAGKLRRFAPNVLVAVGPEAVAFVSAEFRGAVPRRIFTMVRNPEQLISPFGPWCGAPLRVPADRQLAEIARNLPSIHRLGILFDPAINGLFFSQAQSFAARYGLRLVALKISAKKQITETLQASLGRIDGLWLIPDSTVISESIVEFIIKQMLLDGVPVIGFNRFFYDLGAALAFVFDYSALGEQAGHMAIAVLSGKPCHVEPPVFQVRTNHEIIRRLKLSRAKGAGF